MKPLRSILLVAPYVSLPGEPNFNRFLSLCYLWAPKYSVTLVTSSFCHWTKEPRRREHEALADLPFKLVLIDEPGYQKNVSVARYLSHRTFHKAFKRWLLNEYSRGASFDLVYSAFPLISTNLTLGSLKHQLRYKFVIDVQDIWPDSIFSAVPLLAKAGFLLAPLRKNAHRAYGYADGLVAVSETYLQVARSHCANTMGQVTYLGSDYQLIESIPAKALDPRTLRMVYLGTLSHSYDVETVIRGFVQLDFIQLAAQLPQPFERVELHILGDGPNREKLEKIVSEAAVGNIVFHGYLPYKTMAAFVKSCHFFINPIVGSATQSVTNKLSDYIAFGLPIISSQNNWEAMELVNARGGYRFEAGLPESFAAITAQALTAYESTHKEDKAGNGERGRDRLDTLFDRRTAYPKITEFIERVHAMP